LNIKRVMSLFFDIQKENKQEKYQPLTDGIP